MYRYVLHLLNSKSVCLLITVADFCQSITVDGIFGGVCVEVSYFYIITFLSL